jgi:hypothetical protein
MTIDTTQPGPPPAKRRNSGYQALKAWVEHQGNRRMTIFMTGMGIYVLIAGALVETGSPQVILCGMIALSMVSFIIAWAAACFKF